MSYPVSSSESGRTYTRYLLLSLLLILIFAIAFGGYKIVFNDSSSGAKASMPAVVQADAENEQPVKKQTLMTQEEYDRLIAHITNGDSSGKWPVKTPLPLEGSIFPAKRVVAFYGNLYSKQMGILGE